VVIEVNKTTWHCFPSALLSSKFAFPICEHSVRRNWQVRHTSRNFSCIRRHLLDWVWRLAILVLSDLLEGTYYAMFW